MGSANGPVFSTVLDRAIRRAAEWHQGQTRKASVTPYIVHPFGVMLLLDRFGFDEDLLIAGLLHDVVEDTEVSLQQIEEEFGSKVAEIVAHCSETKRDGSGAKRPWADRKRDHLEALAKAPIEARAVVLADKLHNLISIRADLEAGRPIWTSFNADRADVLDYYRTAIERLGDEEELQDLVSACLEVLNNVKRLHV